MNVLHLIAPGPIGGAERVVLLGTEALRGQGVDATLAIMGDTRAEAAAEAFESAATVPRICLRSTGAMDASLVLDLHTVLRQRFDLVHVHGYKALTYALMVRPKALPIVATHHGDTAIDRRVRGYESLAHKLYPRCEAIFAVSRVAFEALLAGGIPADRVVHVTNFVSLQPNKVTEPRPRPHNGLSILYLGRLSPEKGLDILLEALTQAPSSMRLSIAGDGSERTGLERLVDELGLRDRVEFLGFKDDVTPLLDAAHVVALPSRREGLPMALLEAAAAGLPVVASNVGGVSDVLVDGQTGLLVPPDDAMALTNALTVLESRYDELANAAALAAPNLRARFSVQRWAELTAASYRKVLR